MERVYYIVVLCTVFYTAPSRAQGPEPNLGENVTVHAQVMYDNTFKRTFSNGTNETFMRTYFENIFKKVEEGINKKGVMVKIRVANVSCHNKLAKRHRNGTYFKKINGKKTLRTLIKYAQSLNHSNDSIHYLFVAGPFDVPRIQTDDLHTNNTFCTKNASAAVVETRIFPKHFYHYTTQKMTALTHASRETKAYSQSLGLDRLEDAQVCSSDPAKHGLGFKSPTSLSEQDKENLTEIFKLYWQFHQGCDISQKLPKKFSKKSKKASFSGMAL
uniref:Putative secreted peptide n=1 Tax=Rhipicephalus microplus TaxID=6941 RepID=A0A6G5A383_RHIMP